MSKEFTTGPGKELAGILDANGITTQAKPSVTAIPVELANLLADVTAREEDCLKRIHARYCIPRALGIDVGDISRYVPGPEQKPNYWEYWFKWGTPQQFFLMSRNFYINDAGLPVLDIVFHKDLMREGD